MTYKIRILRQAQVEMREIQQYIAVNLDNPTAAKRRTDLIDKTIVSLRQNPKCFPLVRDDYLAAKGVRMAIAKNHLVFYVVREEIGTVSILRVLSARRDWQNLLRKEFLDD